MAVELGTIVLVWVTNHVWQVAFSLGSVVAGVLLQVIGDRVARVGRA